MNFIRNLPWGWIAGIAAVFIVGRSITSQLASVKESVSATASNSSGITPMFGVSAGGSYAGSSADVQPLGGDEWGVMLGDTGKSDAVLIQESNERVAKENIALQRYVTDKSFALLYQPMTSTNNTGNMGAQPLPAYTLEGNPVSLTPEFKANLEALANNPQAQFQAGYTTPSQNINTGRVSTSAATDFIAAQAKNQNWYAVYDEAKSRGYSAAETAALINRAGVTSTGALSASDVNAWTREKGLTTLH